MSHRRLADEILDSLADVQAKWNDTMDKLDADTAGALDTDYEAVGAITDVFEADGVGSDAQHKQSLRKSLRSALAHRKLADEIADALEEMSVGYNALLVKLDAEGGTLASTDFVADLGLEVMDADGEGSDAQHKASLRKSLRSALAHKRLADEIMDAMVGMQEAMNGSLAELDGGGVNGLHEQYKVSELDPDA
jgi:hypothetical protein